ncbi:MAG: CopG family transcriptional regulator [Pseudomonadota bacterium]
MAKPRINVHITREVWKRLDLATQRPGVTKAAIVDAALAAFLSPEAEERRDALILRRLDRVDQRAERLERDLTVTAETLALFVRYYLTMTPPLPEQDRRAAQALGRERFEGFLDQVTKRLATGSKLSAQVLVGDTDDDGVSEAPDPEE